MENQIIKANRISNIYILETEKDLVPISEGIYNFNLIDEEGYIKKMYASIKCNDIKRRIKCTKLLYHVIKNNSYIFFYTKKYLNINNEKFFLIVNKIQ